MNKSKAKRLVDIVLLTALLAIVFATCLILIPNRVGADAAGETASLMLSVTSDTVAPDGSVRVLPGKVLTFTLTATSTQTSKKWSTIEARIAPLLSGVNTTDANIFQYLEFADEDAGTNLDYMPKFIGADAADFTTNYDFVAVLSQTNGGFLKISPYVKLNLVDRGEISASKPMIIEFKLKVKEEIKDANPAITTMTFGVKTINNTYVSYQDGSDVRAANIGVNRVDVGIKIPSSDTTLSSLKMGPDSTNLDTVAFQETGMEYVYNDKSMVLFVQPTANDGATIKIGTMLISGEAPVDVASGATQQVKLNPTSAQNYVTLYISTTAEDGTTKKNYEVKIKIAYVELSALTVTVNRTGDTSTETVTKSGMDGTFAPETTAYTVNVPSDIDFAAVVARTPVDTSQLKFGINSSLSIAASGCTVALGTAGNPGTSLTANSGASLRVASITDNATLTITATAHDGTTKKNYVLTFKVFSVDASIDTTTIKVKGDGSNKEYPNDAAKASESDPKVDFFFVLDEEPGEVKGKILVSFTQSDSTATIDGIAYSNETAYVPGTYTLVVTAPAGNTKSYTITISGQLVIELSDTSNYDFIFEKVDNSDPDEPEYYRASYKKENMKHGVDDKNFDRLVIGNILPETSIMAFLGNFDTKEHASIKLYDNKGRLIFDLGSPATGITAEELNDSDEYSIGTGWYIEFGKGATPNETVYLSVLGDLNSDGSVSSSDSVLVTKIVGEKYPASWNNVEFRLAAYVRNKGGVSSSDAVAIIRIAAEKDSPEIYM